jgi:hypothetical protein
VEEKGRADVALMGDPKPGSEARGGDGGGHRVSATLEDLLEPGLFRWQSVNGDTVMASLEKRLVFHSFCNSLPASLLS